MKYRDVVEFEPIVSIKVLREADDFDRASEDVRTFVISTRMREQLRDVILPNLQFTDPRDNKGILTVANYGTGKTHLMSVISAIAEHSDLADQVHDGESQEAFRSIAGRFSVIRAEIGHTHMSLRDIVCTELEHGLKKIDVDFSFPPAEKVTNTKDSLVEMMTAFESVHGDKGLLFVLDELLDYLRGRRDTELIQDLAFLREIGEICRTTKFRFIGGVQEAIFDNPRFAGVADAVKRVKDRFEQIRIVREDVAFVVKERLLKKNSIQRESIRDHLQRFTPLYEGMAESLDEFVDLFPVHPAYLKTFERITAVEKRTALTTLSEEMDRILDDEVPDTEPGVISYDSYRARLAEDPSNRSIPEVREILDKTDVLRSRIEKGIPTKQYVPVALRIIDGLAVHRLTTDDIYVPIGATKQELRDDLCLLPPNLPEQDAFFLETTIASVVADIMKAVSGQFISENPDNGQIYLDVRKDIDYDQKIEDRASSLDDERLDDGYFKALQEVLELRDAPYVAGYDIWEYELPWVDRNVTRFGYLFMGAPNERSTAQPPRDFYIYFLQPYDRPKFNDDEKPDEVFFRLDSPDDAFTEALRRYAGATALAAESTATHRTVYEDKARAALKSMVDWLRAHMGEAITVIQEGEAKPLAAWLGGEQGPRTSVKEQVDTIAQTALTKQFGARYPGYPRFEVAITRANLPETVRQALTQIATGRSTNLGTKALRSLDLIDSDGAFIESGEFASALLDRLKSADGQVVNRTDLLTERDRGVLTWPSWHLEPAWLVVVAAVLTQLGRMEIGLSLGQVDALTLDRLTKVSVEELEGFTYLAPPKALPVVQLREVLKLLGLPPGFVSDQGIEKTGVQQLLSRASEVLDRVVEARGRIQDGMSLWGAQVIEQADERDRRLESLKMLLENLKARNTVGKMNKLDVGTEAIQSAKEGLTELNWVEAAVAARGHLADVVEFLLEASGVFGASHPLSEDASSLRYEMLQIFRDAMPPEPVQVAELRSAGNDLRRRFADEAIRAHERDRLDGAGDERKREILEGETFANLRHLSAITLLAGGGFDSLQARLSEIGSCKTFDPETLISSVICPECQYQPRPSAGASAKATVEAIDSELETLLKQWIRTLVENLAVSQMQEFIDYLPTDDRVLIDEFLKHEGLAQPVDSSFVRILNEVFGGFEVRRVTSEELWSALFPADSPTTLVELRTRFNDFLDDQIGGKAEEKIRVVPADRETESQ